MPALPGLQFVATIEAALALVQRYQRGAAFRKYVNAHGVELLVAVLVLAAAPLVLIGNLGLLLYVFFSWIESRAVTAPRPHGRAGAWLHAKLGANLGAPPPVPWLLAALVVGLPFLMVLWLSWPTALVLALLAASLPVLYARADQAGIAKA